MHLPTLLCLPLAWALAAPAGAVPYTPDADSQVLERLPGRATDPRQRDLAELRRRAAAAPNDMALAVALARRYFDEVAAEGDPRYIGYAQAALAPWWNQPEPPPPVRLVRALLLQFSHQFDAAVADLGAATRAEPDNGEAWSWLAAIAMVQARYADARAACARVAALASPLIGVACTAYVDSMTGRAAAAAAALHAALARQPDAAAPERLWALTRLAEIEARRGAWPAAEGAFRAALALDLSDGYLLAAYADFLLDRGRPAEVEPLLRGRERSDLLLLRLALAAQAAGAPTLAAHRSALAARFDAARLRGDVLHEKEEARFALAVLGEPARALRLAGANFRIQREAADARVLLEAAVAAGEPAAAGPVLQWMAESGVESVVLRALAERLRAAR